MFEQQYPRPCGRLTKAGTPCKSQVYGRAFACKLHTTELEKQLLDAYEQGHSEGYAQGRQSAESLAKLRNEHLEGKVKKLEEQLDAQQRRFEDCGAQVVTVDGYGYRWTGPGRLEVGDHVLLPENYVSALRHGPGPFPGMVTALGTTYSGALSTIVARVPDQRSGDTR
ncbi:hypothetical protein ACFXAF_13815 [Kitasatospora sp. NPDC059463]|uniref:hypothetical protein n=1 Tax=unclassified Kitasatospora TaxID=2633591 RepID=UPI0036B43CE7